MKNIIVGISILVLIALAAVASVFIIPKPAPVAPTPYQPVVATTSTSTLPTETISNPKPTKPVATKPCYVGGCSSEVCSDTEGVASNCIYRESFACYKTAKCERQADGKCGWTQTTELKTCIAEKNN